MRNALLMFACLAALPAAATVAVVPQPRHVVEADGAFALDRVGAIDVEADDAAPAARRLDRLLPQVHGVHPRKPRADRDPRIRFVRDAGEAMPEEGYRVQVTPREVVLAARSIAGFQHAVSTLVQLVERRDGHAVLPAVTIDDAPRFRWRGVMVDSARHFQSKAFLLRFLQWMALHKLNVLHWHLTDDQAWRLEIRKYPRLAKVGGWREPAYIGPGPRPKKIGGFYTQDDVREIVAEASRLGITVVPEIDMPGHATAAMAAYPELAAIDQPPRRVPADWGIYPNVYSLDESTFAFLDDVLREVIALFPGPYVHIGGDEVQVAQWLSPRGRERMRVLGIDDPKRLQPYFTQRVAKFVAANGRRAVGWDEILDGPLPEGAVVMSWRGTAGALEAARRGYDTVVAAHPTLYFDNRQSAREEEPPGRTRTIGVDDVYAFDPVPAGLGADEARHILGVEATLWSEHIRTEGRLAVMAFPRLAAVAERGWSAPESIDAASFRRRLDALMRLYPAIGLAESAKLERLREEPLPPPAAMTRTSRQLRLCSEAIGLMLEDDAPATGPRAVFALDLMGPCWTWAAAPLDGAKRIVARVGQLPFNFQIGDDVNKIHFPAPRTAAGELEVHADNCEGEVLARLPLAAAARSDRVTTLSAPLPAMSGARDLCFRFAQPALEPLWALDRVELAR